MLPGCWGKEDSEDGECTYVTVRPKFLVGFGPFRYVLRNWLTEAEAENIIGAFSEDNPLDL